MRIWGVLIPPGHLRWSAAGAGVVVLAVLVAVTAGAVGLFGDSAQDTGSTVRATIVAGTPCDRAGGTETVTFQRGGRAHEVRFDGCGHAEGEGVEVTVPPGSPPPDLVVHAADAAVGGTNGEDLGALLITASGAAGAGYAFLLRRGPRTTPLPPPLRLA